jgi:glycosyltransferase involved in cell wall biosynthesis
VTPVTVQVLVSTYNGAAYLKAQIDSLLAQDHAPVKILVRDDGSSDGTVALLREYQAAHPGIEVVLGANLGFAQSFLTLLTLSSPTADYIAFCDQDDVWRPGKISRAAHFLKAYPKETPTLYCSRFTVVDENLGVLGQSRILKRELSFRNALVECPTPGPTIVISQAARRLLLQGIPPNIYSHDWWAYLVVSAFGKIVFDDEPTILYRQHASNVVGTRVGFLRRVGVKIRRFWKIGKRQVVLKQAEELSRLYGPALTAEQRWTLERFVGSSRKQFLGRLRYACSCDVYRQSAFDSLVLRALISLNRL